jgi:hypothetical protein|eukprot:SAG25_NODE_154_length_13563_cov_44.588978_7_plen_86_part_00
MAERVGLQNLNAYLLASTTNQPQPHPAHISKQSGLATPGGQGQRSQIARAGSAREWGWERCLLPVHLHSGIDQRIHVRCAGYLVG